MSEISASAIKKQGEHSCSSTSGCDSGNMNSKKDNNEEDSDDSETEGLNLFKFGTFKMECDLDPDCCFDHFWILVWQVMSGILNAYNQFLGGVA